ncbi:MAG TPA: Gfo/Idh/MocA family oxidoreductase [Treponema sp.]|nr:Gfo/Idh/MocA family oxidoreductase [Treponema sp.]
MSKKVIRWGIVATGGIAEKFAAACRFESARTGNSELYAVASRSMQKAAAFAQAWGIPHSHGSYKALFSDPAIDAVYIATPHNLHAELSIQALKAGKAVLCEKPVSIVAADFYPVIETARKEGRFFMEAMWMKFNPAVNKALSWVHEGILGPLTYLRSDFFLHAPYDSTSRLFDPALGGGALLDVGIYPVTAAILFAGKKRPAHIDAFLDKDEAGVDRYNRMHFTFDSGLKADLSSAITLHGIDQLRSLVVLGETGAAVLPLFWMAQQALLLSPTGETLETFDSPFPCNGYEYEIREVERCLAQGLLESPVQTWDDSIMVMEILDQIRQK